LLQQASDVHHTYPRMSDAQSRVTMNDSDLPIPSDDDIENLLQHLGRLGQRADPDLHPDEVSIWVGK